MSTPSEHNPPQTTRPVHQPLLYLFLAACSGIAADGRFPLPAAQWWAIGLASLAVWFGLWSLRFRRLALVSLLLAVAAAAGCWHHGYWRLYRHDSIGRAVDELRRPICVRGEIISGPRRSPAPPASPLRTIPRGDASRLEVKLTAARDGRVWRPISGRAAVSVEGHLLGLACGDRIMLLAMADVPPEASGPGEFDLRKHLRSQRQLCRLSAGHPDCLTLERPGSPWRADRLLEQARRRGMASLWRHLDDKHAPLAAAMTLGYREQLDRQVWDKFIETGSVHLLAISGLHVGILAMGLFGAARLLGMRQSTTLALVMGVVIGYALLVELRPPVTRAAAIVVMLCLARWCGREAPRLNSLAAAGLVVLALNPSDLYRPGPQFSFLAVAVLCAVTPWFVPRLPSDPLQRLIANSRPWPQRKLRQMAWRIYGLFGASAAIWLAAMPLTMYHYHICSPSALVVYPLVALPVTVAMLSGFGVLLCGALLPPLADGCGWVCGASLSLIEGIVQTAHATPGAYVWIAGPSAVLVIGYYGLLAGYAALSRGRLAGRWPAVIALAWISSMTLGSALSERQSATRTHLACTFINVGHGTSVLVELPGGRRLLYDAGSLGEPAAGERLIAAGLWSRGITHLDAVVLSHADADHYNALPALLDKFSVGVVYVSPVMFDEPSPGLLALRQAIERRGIPLRELYASDRIILSGGGTDRQRYSANRPPPSESAVIEVLHPPRKGVLGSDNANSIVLDIAFAGRRILLPGDLESPGIDDVMAEEPRVYDVVMAPHHGSANSNPRGFAAWSQPRYVVISGGRGGDVSEVRSAYQRQGAEALHTADDGAIRVEIDRQALRVRSCRRERW